MSWQHLATNKPVCRKPKRCIWCGDFIATGERFVNQVGKYEGDFQSNNYHEECDKAALQFFADPDNDCFDPRSFKRGTTQPR